MFTALTEVFRTLTVDDPDAALEEVAQGIVAQGLAGPAVVMLEASAPLAFLNGPAAVVATPFLGAFVEPMRLQRMSSLFADRAWVRRLAARVEELGAAPRRTSPPAGEP